jgi:hypothetical protein
MKNQQPEFNEFGTERWRNEEGKLHRLGGPALKTAAGAEGWFINGKHHRLDGPAVKSKGFESWCFDGKWFSKEEFDRHPFIIFYRLSKGNV